MAKQTKIQSVVLAMLSDSKVTDEAKAKAIVDAVTKAKTSKKSKMAKPKSPTIDSMTMELLRKDGGVTVKEIAKAIKKAKPSHDLKVLEDTSKRRVTGYLQNKFGVKIVKDDDGKYAIKVTKAKNNKPVTKAEEAA